MTYDELEAQYFINLQKIKSFEDTIKNSLDNVLALEEENVRLELVNSSTNNELLIKTAKCSYATQEAINLKHAKELMVREIQTLKNKAVHYNSDALGWRQDNRVEYTDEYYPRYSTSLPMERYSVPVDNIRNIVLHATDIVGHTRFKDPNNGSELHVYAKCDNRIIRYATHMSILQDMNIDAEEVIDDLLYGLKQLIMKERNSI